jgi:hypothetical protein
MYAFSREKLAGVLLEKARRMVSEGGGGLPRSLEERFVKGVLEVPVLGERREGEGVSIADSRRTSEGRGEDKVKANGGGENGDDDTTGNGQQQNPAAEQEEEVIPSSSSSADTTNPEILHLLRLRLALSFLQTSYLPPSLPAAVLQPHIASLISFHPLETHLAHISALKKEAVALRSLSDNISRKRPLDEDDDEKGEAKRRKEEEERARKKKLEGEKSVGLRRLGKVDVSGMKKMSSFFGKAAVVKGSGGKK